MPVIPATQEAEVGGSQSEDRQGKIAKAKRAGVVGQVVE
jgi:hypothetical protein